MKMTRAHRISFLNVLRIVLAAIALSSAASFASDEDGPNIHNMLMFGNHAMFLSHLPMFDGLDEAGTEFKSPHRYQVILEAKLTAEQQQIYLKDRAAHIDTPYYTIGPEQFVISRLFTPGMARQMTSFNATVFRGHLERGGTPVFGLESIVIKIARVVHGRRFDPRDNKPNRLEYVLMGRGAELFLAHIISAPPDFDHVLQVEVIGRTLTDHDLDQDIHLIVSGRRNAAAQRLRSGQRVKASLRVGQAVPSDVQLKIGPEIYFEEGELAH